MMNDQANSLSETNNRVRDSSSVSDAEYQEVQEFHSKFDIRPALKPTLLGAEVLEFRKKFMQEELDEFIEATKHHDLVGAFDALLDLVWVAKGTADMMGISADQWTEGWEEVVRANMSKRRATSAAESKRGSALDIVKPVGWVGPEEVLRLILTEIRFADRSHN